MKKGFALLLALLMLCGCVAESADMVLPLTITDHFGLTAEEWMEDAYMRALLTELFTMDYMVSNAAEHMPDLTKNSFVGRNTSGAMLLCIGTEDDGLLIVTYMPGSGQAEVSFVDGYSEEGAVRMFDAKGFSCEKNDTMQILQVLKDLQASVG